MQKTFKLVTFVVLLCVSLQLNAQEEKLAKVVQITYNENVNLPLTTQEMAMITEVYGEHTQQYVLDNPQQLKSIKNILRNRVEVYQENTKDLSDLVKLSEVPLYDAFNDQLQRDVSFNPNGFNALKYDFNFYSRDITKRFRVDNTNYVIVIYSQYQF